MWAGFRVARRARPVGLKTEANGHYAVRCAHDGYRRLPGKVKHLRQWSFSEGRMMVEDWVSGRHERAEARFHLHPTVGLAGRPVTSNGRAEVLLQLRMGQSVRLQVEGGALREEASSWHPAFGRSEPNVCLVVDFNHEVLRTRLDWGRAR